VSIIWTAREVHGQGGHHRRVMGDLLPPAGDPVRDASAVAITDELEPRLVRAIFDPIFAAGGIQSYNGTSSAYDVFPQQQFVATPNRDGAQQGDAYGGGFEGYLEKILDQLDDEAVSQPFTSAVTGHLCGTTGLSSCEAAIDAALVATYDALVKQTGGARTWRAGPGTPLSRTQGPRCRITARSASRRRGIVGQPDIEWQNRPTFQQAVTFPAHRPRT
jgi:hypothetical protein